MSEEAGKCCDEHACGCVHHKFGATLIVAFGLLFLGEPFGWWGGNFVSLGWPVLIIMAGLFKLSEGMCKCC